MSLYQRSRYIPQMQNNIARQMHGSVYSETQHGEASGKSAHGVGWPFPSRPVSHRRPHHTSVQDSLQMYEFKKVNISKQPKKHLLLQEYNSNGITEIPGYHHLRKDSHRLPSEEIQMARAIHLKQLMLQEKLWRVEEKIKQKIQWDSAGSDAGNDWKGEEESHNKKVPHTKTRLPDQHWRKPMKSRDMLMQEQREEDVKNPRKRYSQDEGSKRDRHEQERGNKETYDITINKQKVSGELDKFRWQNVKKYTREQAYEKNDHCWEEAGVRPYYGTEKTNEREVNKTLTGNIPRTITRDNKYRERTSKDMYYLDNKQDMPQISQHKVAQRQSTENHRGAEWKTYEESTLPPVSRPQQNEMGHMDSTDASFQLLLCRICNRKFASGRLQKHVQICVKVNQSNRQVFNSYNNRTKGSAIEEFWKNHSRSKTPEFLQKTNQRGNQKTHTKNLHRSRLPAVTYK